MRHHDALYALQETLPSKEQLVHFHAIEEFLNSQVQGIYPAAGIVAYGSLGSNLQLPDSDVDVCVTFEGVEVQPFHGLDRSMTTLADILMVYGSRLLTAAAVLCGSCRLPQLHAVWC